MPDLLERLRQLRSILNKALAYAGGAALLSMVALSCTNILLRSVWLPVTGTFELMGFLGAVVAAFALGYTQLTKGHIAVTFLEGKLPRAVERACDVLANLIGLCFFVLAALEVAKLGRFLVLRGEFSETLAVPYYPVVFAVALACLIMALTMLVDLLASLVPAGRKGR
jgi:TRAP-type C4-dicarboxylate transport system permease small subunit